MKNSKKLYYYLLFYFILIIFTDLRNAYSKIEVMIDDGMFEPLPVAIAEFECDNLDSTEFCLKLRKVVVNDLERSGIFRIISNEAFLEVPSIFKVPTFNNWRTINANMLLLANVSLDRQANQIEINYKLWDSFKAKELERGRYRIGIDGWRRISHKIASSIYKKFLGVEGYFDSRIVFISEKGSGKNKVRRLAIMDQDGSNFRFLSSGKELVLSPRFDPNSQRIVYTCYKYKNKPSKVYVLDLETGERKLIGNLKGMTFAANFAPDGRNIVMSLAKRGITNIYEIEIATGVSKQLTNHFGSINTSPSYSPDGRNIVFNSDRDGGVSQIYVMNRDGTNIKRISSAEGRYRTPAWSPDGEWIAFTKILSGNFYTGIMRSDGSDERLLTSSWLEEGPSWAPNSKLIIFSREKRNGENQLYVVDINGNSEKLFYSPTSASQPSWSAHLD